MNHRSQFANKKQVNLDSPHASTGYVRVPNCEEVFARSEKLKRAPKVSPLLEEYMQKMKEGQK